MATLQGPAALKRGYHRTGPEIPNIELDQPLCWSINAETTGKTRAMMLQLGPDPGSRQDNLCQPACHVVKSFQPEDQHNECDKKDCISPSEETAKESFNPKTAQIQQVLWSWTCESSKQQIYQDHAYLASSCVPNSQKWGALVSDATHCSLQKMNFGNNCYFFPDCSGFQTHSSHFLAVIPGIFGVGRRAFESEDTSWFTVWTLVVGWGITSRHGLPWKHQEWRVYVCEYLEICKE